MKNLYTILEGIFDEETQMNKIDQDVIIGQWKKKHTPSKYEIPTAQGNLIKTLVLPGAYSVDKYVRLANNWSWFPQEQCNEEEMAAGVALAQSDSYDLVLSHNSVWKCFREKCMCLW